MIIKFKILKIKLKLYEKISALNAEGNWIRKKQIIAETFNNYFLSVSENKNVTSKQSNNNISNSLMITHTHYLCQSFSDPFPNMKIKPVSTKEVENMIKSLKLKNSFGYDGVSTNVLKLSSLFISFPLTYICNKSIAHGKFPDHLKYSEIKPLYKKG
jgi:hypothetical protein